MKPVDFTNEHDGTNELFSDTTIFRIILTSLKEKYLLSDGKKKNRYRWSKTNLKKNRFYKQLSEEIRKFTYYSNKTSVIQNKL